MAWAEVKHKKDQPECQVQVEGLRDSQGRLICIVIWKNTKRDKWHGRIGAQMVWGDVTGQLFPRTRDPETGGLEVLPAEFEEALVASVFTFTRADAKARYIDIFGLETGD